VLFHTTAPPLTIWRHWFASDAIGIITVAPLLFELILAVRDPPSRREVIEGTLALSTLTAFSVFIVQFPSSTWALELTIAGVFPLLLWVAARCRPLFAATATFIFALAIVWTTTFEFGFFGNPDLPVDERILAAQLSILAQSLCALVLAALFAERRRSVVELLQSEQQLRDALKAEQDADRAKSIFLAAASHDLRQPLQTLNLLQVALKPRMQDSESQRLLSGIERAVDVMNGMLISLLDINQLESGALRPLVTDFPVNDMFDSLTADFFKPVTEKGLQWRLVRSDAWVRTDRRMLEEMVRNLLSNAVRYTDRGKILMGCRKIGGTVRIEVWDSGVGITGEHIPKIFDEYYQAPGVAQLGGFGLGLAIVQRMAKILGHRVGVTSTPGRGSGFSIEVPQSRSHLTSPSLHRADVGQDQPLSGTVLVIEDESTVRAAFTSLLESYGLNVTAVATVDEALPLIASKGSAPDLVLSDYNLPGKMNGVESIKALRAALDCNIPAIVVTGDTRKDVVESIAGYDVDIMVKPVHPDELRRLMVSMLSQQSRTAEVQKACV
jgi:signal transduction histidine kinase/CheY-like chemotaxis protein